MIAILPAGVPGSCRRPGAPQCEAGSKPSRAPAKHRLPWLCARHNPAVDKLFRHVPRQRVLSLFPWSDGIFRSRQKHATPSPLAASRRPDREPNQPIDPRRNDSLFPFKLFRTDYLSYRGWGWFRKYTQAKKSAPGVPPRLKTFKRVLFFQWPRREPNSKGGGRSPSSPAWQSACL